MGREFDRMKSYENRYYARTEGRERARRKRQTNKVTDYVVITILFIGIFIFALSPNIFGKILGIIIAGLCIAWIIWSIRYYRNR